jgi:quercetin dioxygenase-like cupin family protein
MIDFSDETSVVLREGDSVWFEASRRHRHLNVGDTEAHIITFKSVTDYGLEGPGFSSPTKKQQYGWKG